MSYNTFTVDFLYVMMSKYFQTRGYQKNKKNKKNKNKGKTKTEFKKELVKNIKIFSKDFTMRWEYVHEWYKNLFGHEKQSLVEHRKR